MSRKLSFKGRDWMELAEYFGAEITGEQNLDCNPEGLIKYISEKSQQFTESTYYQTVPSRCPYTRKEIEEGRLAVKACRGFIEALVSASAFYSLPVFEGLSKVEDDETFIKYFLILLPNMWT